MAPPATSMGTAKPMPMKTFCSVGLTMPVTMPTTCPFRFRSGPPEFPGFTAASIWIRPCSVSVLLGVGNGSLQAAASYATGGAPWSVAAGDFNAFEFSDGLVDVMGTVRGTPAPAEEVVDPAEFAATHR